MNLKPGALPSTIDQQTSDPPYLAQVYQQLLELEAAKSNDNNNIIYARVLGYLLLAGPSNAARVALAGELWKYGGNRGKLLKCGEHYFYYFICAFKKGHGRNEAPTNMPSPFWRFPYTEGGMQAPLGSHEKAKLAALQRDNYQCLATGAYDYAKDPGLEASDMFTAATQCAYIIPSSINQDLETKEGTLPSSVQEKLDYATNFWDILELLGYGHLKSHLSGNKIHNLENILTLSQSAHDLFDRLKLWFEHTDQPHVYKPFAIQGIRMLQVMGMKSEVEFSSPDPTNYPLPSTELLAIHAACCRVAWLSGAGVLTDKVQREMEETRVLAEDGSSANLLQSALHIHLVPQSGMEA